MCILFIGENNGFFSGLFLHIKADDGSSLCRTLQRMASPPTTFQSQLQPWGNADTLVHTLGHLRRQPCPPPPRPAGDWGAVLWGRVMGAGSAALRTSRK